MFRSTEHDRHLQDSLLKCLRQTNEAEHGTHFWRKKSPFNFMSARVCFIALGNIHSTHTWWTNPIPDVPCLPQGEEVFRMGSSTSMSGVLLHRKGKIILSMKGIISNLTFLGGMIGTAVTVRIQCTRNEWFHRSNGGWLGVTWTRSLSLLVLYDWLCFLLDRYWPKSQKFLRTLLCSKRPPRLSRRWGNWSQNFELMNGKHLLIFRFWKHFRSVYFTIYQHIIWINLQMNSEKLPREPSHPSLAFATGHICHPISASGRLRHVRCDG